MREFTRKRRQETSIERGKKSRIGNFDYAVGLTDAYNARDVAQRLIEALAGEQIPPDPRAAYARAIEVSNERAGSVGLKLEMRNGFEDLDHEFTDWSGSEGRVVTMQAVPDKLTAFLKDLTAADTATPATAAHIKQVTNYLAESVVNGKLTWQEVRPIADALDQLGQTDATMLLGHIVDNAEMGTLREFIQLRDALCFEEKWHADYIPETYGRAWDKAAAAVRRAMQNPMAVSLADIAANNLVHCAQLAIDKFRNYQPKRGDHDMKKHYDELLPVAEQQLTALQTLAQDTTAALDKLHRGE